MREPVTIDLETLLSRTQLCRDYPDSFVLVHGTALWLERVGEEKLLAVASLPGTRLAAGFRGSREERPLTAGSTLRLCPTDTANATILREALPWLRPQLLGLSLSAGFGDRLGLATPGHVRALKKVQEAGTGDGHAPIFAQQSIREMGRTGRTPEDVLRDATWGAFQAGWHGRLGADADHLKSTADIDATVAAGYSFFTFDPGEHVDAEADRATPAALRRKLERVPWRDLECDFEDLRRRYEDRSVELEHQPVTIDGMALARAAAKYGVALAHVSRLYRHLAGKGKAFEVEISVDETETPTSLAEHVYIVGELRRLGVRWVSLAPRYVGRFEKGVDFIGDLDGLRANLIGHAAIARAFGPYKLSLHSGSDKFSVYPLIQEATGGLVHLKTAGTSYLEALRVTARLAPDLFREILALARMRYAHDRASYHVSADLGRVPEPEAAADGELEDLLNRFDTRQVLHVTFGSVLAAHGPSLLKVLRTHEHAYSDALERHFVSHLAPFVRPSLAAES